jgi:hypothetical protein
VNLTLIDLPGLTKVAVGNGTLIALRYFYFHLTFTFILVILLLFITEGQPESIAQDIENMVRSYVDKVKQNMCFLFYCFAMVNQS